MCILHSPLQRSQLKFSKTDVLFKKEHDKQISFHQASKRHFRLCIETLSFWIGISNPNFFLQKKNKHRAYLSKQRQSSLWRSNPGRAHFKDCELRMATSTKICYNFVSLNRKIGFKVNVYYLSLQIKKYSVS